MPRLCESLQFAQSVLSLINAREEEALLKYFWVEAFSNGREQGYCIVGDSFCISFSRAKSSDQLVVYHSRSGENFSLDNKPKNDLDWKGEYFSEVDRAAHYIINLMKAQAERIDRRYVELEKEKREMYNKIPSDKVEDYLP